MIAPDRQRRMMDAPMHRVRTIHMVGIGGSGMAGIAEVLLNLGYEVSGSDLKRSASVQHLQSLGARIALGHDAEHMQGADVVVVSTAVNRQNPEVASALAQRIPVIRHAEMLAELMRFRFGIAIAGTHGKTTTTSLVATVLAAGELDPTFVVGGRVKSVGTNARLGEGHYLVAEADESDASFLHLSPLMAAVTNIDADHLETYGGDFQKLKATFVEFLQRLPFYGLAVVCSDDANVREIISLVGRPVRTYGFDEGADVRAVNWSADGGGSRFTVQTQDGWQRELHLNLPGRHNTLNALAAIAIGRELGVNDDAIASALQEFQGIGRRCESHGELRIGDKTALLIDDYGHHPREISATIAGLRASYPQRRLVVIFQPHRYSRTRDLFEDFCEVLSGVDVLLLSEVYAAGESPVAEADGRALARGIRTRGKVSPVFVQQLTEVSGLLADVIEDGDLLLTLGAGDVGSLPAALVERYARGQA